jgi:hypothetical protein
VANPVNPAFGYIRSTYVNDTVLNGGGFIDSACLSTTSTGQVTSIGLGRCVNIAGAPVPGGLSYRVDFSGELKSRDGVWGGGEVFGADVCLFDQILSSSVLAFTVAVADAMAVWRRRRRVLPGPVLQILWALSSDSSNTR